MRGRRAARECVLKILYASEFNEERLETLIDDIVAKEELSEESRDFTRKLALKTQVHRKEFDTSIEQKAEHWDFHRIATLDKIILRMAMCEILYLDIPPKVSISEAIEIAKIYSTENSGSFINGILDSFLHDLRAEGRIFVE
ncbi:MAG TPA: transcription antitermination factor NusB [bacterium]|nr:transcription antitermination factor NusB [bacterium]